jgi:hypothetical protein
VLLALSSCANTPPIVITARTMTALNDTFVGTAAAMDAALDAHHITPEQYGKWKAFGLRFQASGPLAMKLYDAALKSKDDSVRAHAEAVLTDFSAEMSTYAALALSVAHPDGGQ